MKLFKSIIPFLFKMETSLLAFFWKILYRNSIFINIGLSFDLFFTYYLFNSVFESVGKKNNPYGFPIFIVLMWLMNYIVILVQFCRHFSKFRTNIMYYVLLILFMVPYSAIYFFGLAFLPIWIIPCIMKLKK